MSNPELIQQLCTIIASSCPDRGLSSSRLSPNVHQKAVAPSVFDPTSRKEKVGRVKAEKYIPAKFAPFKGNYLEVSPCDVSLHFFHHNCVYPSCKREIG